jgi:hypothetical protein
MWKHVVDGKDGGEYNSSGRRKRLWHRSKNGGGARVLGEQI